MMVIYASFLSVRVGAQRLIDCAIAVDEINYKVQQNGWKALIYRPSSLLHETNVPKGSDRRAVLEESTIFIDSLLET
jgi:hypothetical protein